MECGATPPHPTPRAADERTPSSSGALPPAHQEEFPAPGCCADPLLLMCVDSPRTAEAGGPRVCGHMCAHVWQCAQFGLRPLSHQLGPFSTSPGSWTGSRKLLEALLPSPPPSPRDCRCLAYLCCFGLRVALGRHRAWWGAHLLPHPRLSPCSDHCPALPLYSLNPPLQCPPPFLLPAFAAPCPTPHLLISLSSGATPPGSLPCCPRCQFLSLRGPRVQTGSVCLSLRASVEYGGLSCVSLSVPINRPRAPWGLVLHQIQLFLVPSLGS